MYGMLIRRTGFITNFTFYQNYPATYIRIFFNTTRYDYFSTISWNTAYKSYRKVGTELHFFLRQGGGVTSPNPRVEPMHTDKKPNDCIQNSTEA